MAEVLSSDCNGDEASCYIPVFYQDCKATKKQTDVSQYIHIHMLSYICASWFPNVVPLSLILVSLFVHLILESSDAAAIVSFIFPDVAGALDG